jgi:dTDP-4-amino-4,6-dideoxygalactose transaminase
MNAIQAIERTSRKAGALNLGEYLRLLSEVAGLPLRKLTRDPQPNIPEPGRHISYVEAKHPDWSRVAEICRLSERENRWANFGPVTRALALVIEFVTGISGKRVAVVASSATSALQAAAGVHSVNAGRPLRWAVSAFAFPATECGPFAHSIVRVDCDDKGFLSLEKLAELRDEDWDGAIVTHTFGMSADMSRYEAFCKSRDKRLIIDAAMYFPGNRSSASNTIEVLSLHHTKPWGFGEGGCLFVEPHDETLAKSFLNIGIGVESGFLSYATNGKMSDLAAAAIIDRLELMPVWSALYRNELERIAGLAQDCGLKTMGGFPQNSISACLPVLAPGPIALDDLPPARFDCRKYYRPSTAGFITAQGLYDRIINVPCHAEMNQVSSADIVRVMLKIRSFGH